MPFSIINVYLQKVTGKYWEKKLYKLRLIRTSVRIQIWLFTESYAPVLKTQSESTWRRNNWILFDYEILPDAELLPIILFQDLIGAEIRLKRQCHSFNVIDWNRFRFCTKKNRSDFPLELKEKPNLLQIHLNINVQLENPTQEVQTVYIYFRNRSFLRRALNREISTKPFSNTDSMWNKAMNPWR